MLHATPEELAAGWETIRQSPQNHGLVKLIVRRPAEDVREVLDVGELDVTEGLRGDSWLARGDWRHPEQPPDPATQLNIMNSRVVELLARSPDRWPLAGDQFYIDLDLSTANVPPGTRLALGSAEIEVTSEPHTGCRKFAARFGAAAHKFVNSPDGRAHNLRGINARVIRGGEVRVGDVVRKMEPAPLGH